MKSMIICVVLGFLGASIADIAGFVVTDYQWWLICAPFWILGGFTAVLATRP